MILAAAESSPTPGLGSFGAFVGFLLLVVPGLVFEYQRERRRPPRERTPFREASTVALASLGFSAVATLILLAVRFLEPDWLPSFTGLVQAPSQYVATHVHLVARAAAIEVLVACGIATGVDQLLGGQGPGRLSGQEALWLAFHDGVPRNLVPYAALLLTTGVVYRGRIGFIDETGPDEGRRVVLVGPSVRVAPGGEAERVPGHRVVLPMTRVVEMQLGFVDPADLSE